MLPSAAARTDLEKSMLGTQKRSKTTRCHTCGRETEKLQMNRTREQRLTDMDRWSPGGSGGGEGRTNCVVSRKKNAHFGHVAFGRTE